MRFSFLALSVSTCVAHAWSADSDSEQLDPFEEHDDMDLWDVLKRVNLVAHTPQPSQAASRAPSRVPSKTNLLSPDGSTGSDTLVEEEGRVIIKSLDQEVSEFVSRLGSMRLSDDVAEAGKISRPAKDSFWRWLGAFSSSSFHAC
jgi:hypothetical protein